MISIQHIINSDMHNHYDVIALQEPYLDSYGNTRALCHWRVVYPSTHPSSPPNPPSRSVILINSSLNTNSWKQIPFPSPNVTIVQLRGNHGLFSLFNIYLDCEHSNILQALQAFSHQHHRLIRPTDNAHIAWLGDFNRHHPHWDSEADHRLFTPSTL